ncbi:MAG: tetratricopeptide repeat protein [Burkholderiales bacterium]
MNDPIAPTLAQARVLIGQGQGERARSLLQPICRQYADTAEAWFLLGAAEHLCGGLASALSAFDCAVRLGPQHVQAANARAAMLGLLGRPGEALAEYARAHALDPQDARIVVNMAIVLEQAGQTAEALQHYDSAIATDAACFAALLNRSALLLRLGRPEQALADAERAIAANPGACEGHFNRAQALTAADRYEEALAACRTVLDREPRHVGAQVCRALALACLGQIAEARAGFELARSLDPALFRAIVRSAYQAQSDSSAKAGRAEDEMPDPRVVYLVRGVDRLARCDWHGREQFLARFEQIVREGVRSGDLVCERSLPFSSLFLPLAPDVVRAVVSGIARSIAAAAPGRMPPQGMPREPGERLRIGFLSAGFRRHPSAFLNAPILHAFDRARVRSFGYVLNPPDASREAQWLAQGFDALRAAHALDDAQLARLIRDDRIHVLVDESHGYDWSRPHVLAARPAPINICYLGGLVGSGGDWVDYRIADGANGAEGAQFAPECLVRLPRSCWTYATGPLVAAPTPTRAQCGLPQRGTVLCAFSGAYKIDPAVFEAWMRILARVPGAVLWLLGDAIVERNLRAHASGYGIDAARIVFARTTALEQHLARLCLADLFLDTLPCNAHTTALEALHCDVPVLTLTGTTAAGRVGAGMVRAAGLADLVSANLVDYEARAAALAADRAALVALKARLAAARLSCPLWDAADLARCLERVFEMVWARHEAGLPPAALDVPAA